MKSQNEFKTIVEYQEYLRIYFAAIMLQGLVTLSSHQQSHESHATQAIAYADALITALNKTN